MFGKLFAWLGDTAANALAIDVGDDDGNAGAACFLYLGQTNAIFGDAIGIGRQKPSGTMQFNPNLTGNSTRPTAYFRGANASRIATWSIGDQVVNSGSGESATGVCDFSGGSVNALMAPPASSPRALPGTVGFSLSPTPSAQAPRR